MEKLKLNKYNIILASGSPRRQQFLQDLQLDFTIDVREIEEVFPNILKRTEITDFLAKLKSKPFTDLNDNDLLITSDTIVWLNNEAIGKPKDRNDAIKILNQLSGNMHEVITSICFKTTKSMKLINDVTKVYFKDLSKNEIEYYVDNFQPYDKAGSYGIQDWIGYIGVEKIEGSYFNVMGFPVHKFHQEMLKY
ncbi:Maf family nucleotide pyrophosphatase [Urechidicola vernalis]|uniref:dTTP/UTP pyrophosphatase n=1 Tax=Urechidicola vernalis TaxID=3075600 RepID=A0ABU2Y0J5_9FLAO|nr:Maf family nucleotide pyrophosphatase [Urechidicola sp. P050]MDT0551673.1 Maf family nucleotide pyrophosphatase [Urechidicola sp. P050]